tara:strand:+ start:279 stop:401 length:123 start_codon:yes stop_codon:yes gene_type:complete
MEIPREDVESVAVIVVHLPARINGSISLKIPLGIGWHAIG